MIKKFPYWTQVAIFALATVVIVWLMPRTSTSAYIYEVNRPWNYKLLTAPFDIPVHLDSLSVKSACDSIDRTFIPVFRRDQSVDNQVRLRASQALGEVNGISSQTRYKIEQKLKEVYQAGLVDETVYTDIITGRMPSIRVASDNTLTTRNAKGLRSPLKAYEWLKEQLPGDETHYAIEQSKLASMLVPNVVIDTETSDRMRLDLHRKASAPIGVIQQGERIIDRGDIVTMQLFTVLRTYEQMQSERGNGGAGNALYVWGAKLLYVGLLMFVFSLFLYGFRRPLFEQPKVCIFLMLNVVAFSLFAFLMGTTFSSGLYVVPFAMIPIMVLVFFDGRTALFTLLVTVLICAVIAPYPIEFIFMQFVAGVTANTSLREMSRRSQLLRTALMVFVVYSLAYVSLNLMMTGSFASLSGRVFGFCAINVVFISFAYVLIFVFERMFGFTSLVALVELSDINHPVLRELSRECPGTFQHSMAVSNLAAEAAAKVNANVQLVRAGALYHDIGKIQNPAFFTENQHGVNPHDALEPEQSARIILGHVTDGAKKAAQAKLPAVIRRFILEHHGKGTARYFYLTWQKQHPDETPDPAMFTYPGPNPQSVETSILMMADAVEAASRSLKEYTPEAIAQLVNRIIDTQIEEGLHSESPLSFRDVAVIKETFIQRLRTIYHSRVAYPDKK